MFPAPLALSRTTSTCCSMQMTTRAYWLAWAEKLRRPDQTSLTKCASSPLSITVTAAYARFLTLLLQCLLTLLDSPVNKAGRLQVYIHTAKGVLIEVNPSVRIPRTFKRFCGLMGQFQQTYAGTGCRTHRERRDSSTSTSTFDPICQWPRETAQGHQSASLSTFLCTERGPTLNIDALSNRTPSLTTSQRIVTRSVRDSPPTASRDRTNTRLTALSFDAEPVKLSKFLPTVPDTHSVCVFVGAMAHGYVQISFSLN